MDVMTYVLWMLLLVGSVMKNHFLLLSVPKTGQAVPAVGKLASPKFSTDQKNKNVIDFERAVRRTANKQKFGWIDTS